MTQSAKTLIQIQDEYIFRIRANRFKWGTSWHVAVANANSTRSIQKQLFDLGFSRAEVIQAIRDARDMANLHTA